MFCNIVNVFVVTFDQLNASLLNVLISYLSFFKPYQPQTFEWKYAYVFSYMLNMHVFSFVYMGIHLYTCIYARVALHEGPQLAVAVGFKQRLI